MKILNYTPHVVTLYSGGEVIQYPVIGKARVEETSEVMEVEGIPCELSKKAYGDVVGLPDSDGETIYIVSIVVLQSSDRNDIMAPDTGPSSGIRDKEGNLVAVKRFQINENFLQ